MKALNQRLRSLKRRGASIWLFCGTVALGSILVPQARADFIGYYDLSNFTLTSTSDAGAYTSDGFAYTPDNGVTGILQGGNDGLGFTGVTDLLINAPAAGTVQFDYMYNSLDTPGYDSAGYMLNGVYTLLADTDGESGTISFSVNAGDLFGFQAWTYDNMGEPGILTVASFTAPEGGENDGTVPEPRTLPMVLVSAALAAAFWQVKGRKFRSGENR